MPFGLSFENYGHVGYALGRIRDMSAWALGDWVNYGDHANGEKYAQALELTGRSKAGLMNLAPHAIPAAASA